MKTALISMAVLWAAALPLAAVAAGRSGSSGSPSDVFALAVYEIGGAICHQRPERSFRVASVPMAVCARCTGIYVGAAGAAVIAAGMRRRRSATSRPPISARTARLALAVAATPALTTLLFEWISGQTPSNELRALSGIVLGASIAWVLLQLE